MATKYKAQSEKDRCVACGVCVKVCPRDAVSIYKGSYSVVDEENCNNYCGRGQLFLQIGNTLGWSRKKVAPRWLSSKWFRNAFLIFFLFFFIQMIILTVHVAMGAESLRETIHLLWTFNVPWHWAYPTVVEPWVAQFAFGLYGIMLTSLVVGVVLTIIYRPRTWCVFCPMGNMTQMICKLKN